MRISAPQFRFVPCLILRHAFATTLVGLAFATPAFVSGGAQVPTPPSSDLSQLAEATSPFATRLPESSEANKPGETLPDAPSTTLAAAEDSQAQQLRSEGQGGFATASPASASSSRSIAGGRVALRYTKDISAGWQAQPLSGRDKFVLGVRDLYSPGNFGAFFLASGFSHLMNGQPNFGTDRGAYGQRLGATAIRETSQGFLTDSVFAPLLHQDPRYYVLGPDYSLVHRTMYAITRPFVRRNDSGRERLNTSLLLGYGGAALLTEAYYPRINRNARDTMATYSSSIGGAALGFVVSEFADQVLAAVHLHRRE